MEAHFDHMLGELQHVERIRKFSLQTNENKSVCAAHTRILEMVLHGTAEELGEALESHLNRYKLSVEQALSARRTGAFFHPASGRHKNSPADGAQGDQSYV